MYVTDNMTLLGTVFRGVLITGHWSVFTVKSSTTSLSYCIFICEICNL